MRVSLQFLLVHYKMASKATLGLVATRNPLNSKKKCYLSNKRARAQNVIVQLIDIAISQKTGHPTQYTLTATKLWACDYQKFDEILAEMVLFLTLRAVIRYRFKRHFS